MKENIREITNLLPYLVRDKLGYFLGYVHDRLTDIALEEGIHHRIKEVRNEVDLIFLLRLLYGYFVVGFQNYTQMMGFFESKGVNGFQIGSTAFTSQSSISSQWQEIVEELENIIDEHNVALYVKPILSIDEVLYRIIQPLKDDTTETEQSE